MSESGFALVESKPIVAGDHPNEVSLLTAYGANNKFPDLEIQSKAPQERRHARCIAWRVASGDERICGGP
jgi:hypothetical protein